MTELHEHTAFELHQLLQRGEVSPVEATQHFLGRIERLDPHVGAFVHIDGDRALERAAHVQADMPKVAPLWGMPFADKDLVARAGWPTGFGSSAFAGRLAETSDDLALAFDAAGAVSLGKTATPEFGLHAYTEPLAGRPVRNPWNPELGAGGSSGGAAAAVAAGMLPFAPGSDGGGSIRIPAAMCGLVGVKPSRGRVPGGSGLAYLAGLPVAGALARTVTDAALLLDGMIAPTGYPTRHPFAVRAPGDDGPYLGAALRAEGRFQLGVMTDSPWDAWTGIGIDPDARAALERAIAIADRRGHGVEALAPAVEAGYPDAFRAIWQAGAASRAIADVDEAKLEPLTRWLVARGRALGAGDLADALAWLSGFERRTIERFAPFDAVLTPALAMRAPEIGWYDPADAEHNFAQQVQVTPFTSFVNVAGLPAITVPVWDTADGLPMSVQLIGRPGGEATLFAIAAQFERGSGRGTRYPLIW